MCMSNISAHLPWVKLLNISSRVILATSVSGAAAGATRDVAMRCISSPNGERFGATFEREDVGSPAVSQSEPPQRPLPTPPGMPTLPMPAVPTP
eukprot:3449380-Pleurochrysis_carterae.AAC.2